MVDYFGHFWVNTGKFLVKPWGCVFTRMATRAVHIEVLDSLSQDSFIHAYRHFLAIQGKNTNDLFSDNETNLKGASKLLCQTVAWFFLGRFCQKLCNRCVSWHFSPARSSHVNGVVERIIRMIWQVLESLLTRSSIRHPSAEEFRTLLNEVKSPILTHPSGW